MRLLEATTYGYRITLRPPFDPPMLRALHDEIAKRVPRREAFAVLVDLRSVSAFPIETQEILKQCIDLLKTAGMGRQAIVLDDAIAKLQAQRLSKEMGILDLCRFLDASSDAEWETAALDWLTGGVDPYYL